MVAKERRTEHGAPELNFAPREVFYQKAADFVSALELVENNPALAGDEAYRRDLVFETERLIYRLGDDFHPEEIALFSSIWELFKLKHSLTPLSKVTREALHSQSRRGKVIEFMGSLGVGKSIVAETLSQDLGGEIVAAEPFRENPFWQRSQKEPELMLRSQFYFLISNTIAGFKLLRKDGISISDTSRFTDIYMWMEWYHEMGRVNEQEYQLYHRLVGLLKPLMLKPDLLVTLTPTSVTSLKEGVARRAKDQQDRVQELQFTEDELRLETEICRRARRILEDEWGINVLEIPVDPIETFEHPSLRYRYVYDIRKSLEMLGDLIEPSPETVASNVLDFFAWRTGRFAVVCSSTMYTGKTEAMWRIKEAVGPRMVVFRPAVSMRQIFGESETVLVSRDGHEVEVISVGDQANPETNDIRSIPQILAEKGITPEKVSVIGIDELMLFLANRDDPKAVISTIKYLRDLGFNVVVNLVALDYKGNPFHSMDYILSWAKADPRNALTVEMTTRCTLCDKRARVTRLTKEGGVLADYNDDVVHIGSPEFAPVCGEGEHVSCANRPPTLGLDLMPKPEDEYQRLLEECGVL